MAPESKHHIMENPSPAAHSITITDAAAAHFSHLLSLETDPNLNIRLFVQKPYTAQAEVGITYCPQGDEELSDLAIHCQGFTLFVARDSVHALKAAEIDFQSDKLGGQLAIKAPHLRQIPDLGPDSQLSDQLHWFIEHEINPGLASHGGRVRMTAFEDGVVYVQFAGGCQGCGMANMTLQAGIERNLIAQFPAVRAVRDTTDHQSGTEPYYPSGA